MEKGPSGNICKIQLLEHAKAHWCNEAFVDLQNTKVYIGIEDPCQDRNRELFVECRPYGKNLTFASGSDKWHFNAIIEPITNKKWLLRTADKGNIAILELDNDLTNMLRPIRIPKKKL